MPSSPHVRWNNGHVGRWFTVLREYRWLLWNQNPKNEICPILSLWKWWPGKCSEHVEFHGAMPCPAMLPGAQGAAFPRPQPGPSAHHQGPQAPRSGAGTRPRQRRGHRETGAAPDVVSPWLVKWDWFYLMLRKARHVSSSLLQHEAASIMLLASQDIAINIIIRSGEGQDS